MNKLNQAEVDFYWKRGYALYEQSLVPSAAALPRDYLEL